MGPEKVIALVGSPRRLGNSELAARYIAHESGADEVELIHLHSKNILPCKACYRCLEGTCPLDDDYLYILKKILDARGVIIAVPSYFFGPNSSIKRFLDRGLQLYSCYDRLAEKPAVGVCTAGMVSGEGYTLLGLDNMILRMGLKHRGTEILYGALPGEIFMVRENVEKLKDLGRRLAKPPLGEEVEEGDKTACTACRYSYFSFPDKNTASCLICGTRYRYGKGQAMEKIPNTGIHLHSVEELNAHREWLIAMKKRFMDTRRELKKVIMENLHPAREV